MTILIAILMVSIGIPGRDSDMMCSRYGYGALKIGRNTLGFESPHAHFGFAIIRKRYGQAFPLAPSIPL